MQYSTINGKRVLPFPKGKGKCEICNAETVSKCGEKVMWHWAHKSKLDCDPWWENETEWHRKWKERFPENFREIVHICDVTGEKHRADIKSDKGIILEIQNSPISLEELRSRERFYKNLVWIVNADKFKNRFNLYLKTFLPNPNSKEFDDIVFVPTNNAHSCTTFWRRSESQKTLSGMVQIHSARSLQMLTNRHYIGHHPFYWQRPHIAWFEASCPVFLDFGSDILWRLEKYRGQFHCVQAIAKEKVILDIIYKSNVVNIADDHSIMKD